MRLCLIRPGRCVIYRRPDKRSAIGNREFFKENSVAGKPDVALVDMLANKQWGKR